MPSNKVDLKQTVREIAQITSYRFIKKRHKIKSE
jgi:hypothetical protein